MQRNHLSLVLAGGAVFAAAVAPDLLASTSSEPAEARSTLDALPEPAEATSAHLDVRATLDQPVRLSDDDSDRFLVIELSADELADTVRTAVHTAVVVDTSGSMGSDGKIDYARRALHTLVEALGPDDSFSLVEFNSTATVRLPSTPADGRLAITREIDALQPTGGTHIEPGLRLGFSQLSDAGVEGPRRLILLSDGLSGEAAEQLGAIASDWSRDGVTASTIGLGLDFDDRLLTAVADAGGGTYRYVNDPTRLAGLFADELDRMARIAAQNVQVEVSLDGASPVAVYGYEEFDGHRSHDGYSAFIGDMSSGQTRKVVARLDMDAHASAELAEVTVRFTDPETGRSHRIPLTVSATVTDDPATALASLDDRAGRHAARALAGETLNAGIEHWRSGETDKARAVLTDGEDVLAEMIQRFDIADLDEALASIRYRTEGLDRVSATSSEGRTEFLGEQLRALGYME